MKISILVAIMVLLSTNSFYAQNNTYFYYSIRSKMLGPNEYDKNEGAKSSYLKLSFAETIKILGDSVEVFDLKQKYIYNLTYRNGKTETYDGYETTITGYYPTLNAIVLGDCNGDYTVDMNTGKRLDIKDPQYERISPSKKNRITGISLDGMEYYCERMVDGEYQLLAPLKFDKGEIKGLYWGSDDKIYFLAKSYSDKYWIAYSGMIKLRKEQL